VARGDCCEYAGLLGSRDISVHLLTKDRTCSNGCKDDQTQLKNDADGQRRARLRDGL